MKIKKPYNTKNYKTVQAKAKGYNGNTPPCKPAKGFKWHKNDGWYSLYLGYQQWVQIPEDVTLVGESFVADSVEIREETTFEKEALLCENSRIEKGNTFEEKVILFPSSKIGSGNTFNRVVKLHSNSKIGNGNIFKGEVILFKNSKLGNNQNHENAINQ